jgi:antitoxin component YwqK of YwqJK toxin-antitoxin module
MSIGVKKDNKEMGEWLFYHSNGKLWTQGNYNNGVKVGLWKMWNNAGDLLQEYYADNGYSKTWYPNGTQESLGQFKDGKKVYVCADIIAKLGFIYEARSLV